jgi:hypothetical protein
MLIPANVDINVYRTGTFSTKILLWKSLKPLEEFPLSEYEVELVIESLRSLTPGMGLTLENNEIVVALTPAQTEEVTSGARLHYYIKLTKGSEIVFPMRGTMSFISP